MWFCRVFGGFLRKIGLYIQTESTLRKVYPLVPLRLYAQDIQTYLHSLFLLVCPDDGLGRGN